MKKGHRLEICAPQSGSQPANQKTKRPLPPCGGSGRF